MIELSTGPAATRAAAPRVSVLCDANGWRRAFPRPISFLREVARNSLIGGRDPAASGHDELSLVLTDDARQQELNREWRGRDKPTNVLSFPDGTEMPDGTRLLGDVVLALETCRREAREQNKSLADHAAHLVVHGVLHLLGHDHEVPEEAEAMERLEVQLLAGMGIADPYAETLVPRQREPKSDLERKLAD